MRRTLFIAQIFLLGAVGAETHAAEGSANWHGLRRWEQPQGLPQNTVLSLLQTRDGYVWAGTRGGLARFNGVSFTNFDNRDHTQLGDNEIWALMEDDGGTLWISTYGGGVSRYLNGKFTVLTSADGLVNNFVTSFAKDSQGSMWIGTDGGISHWQNGHFTNFTVREGLPINQVRALCAAPDGTIWFGTLRGGLGRISQNRVQTVSFPGIKIEKSIPCIYRDKKGTLWIATSGDGLWSIAASGEIKHYTEGAELPVNWVSWLTEDRAGSLWVGTTKGLLRFADGRFYPEKLGAEDTTDDFVQSIANDREGGLWVGTLDRGFVAIRQSEFQGYTSPERQSEYMFAVTQDDRGDILVATPRGIDVVSGGKITRYTDATGVPQHGAIALARTADGSIWVGTEIGVFRSEPASDYLTTTLPHRFTAVDALQHVSVRVIFEDHEGAIWIGTNLEGVIRYKDGVCTRYTVKDGLANDGTRGVCEDRSGVLWIGTRGGGLSRFQAGKFTTYDKTNGLVGNNVQVLYLDDDGTLWIGAREGLSRYRNGKFTSYTVSDGLYLNFVSGIATDRRGNLWLNTPSGVFRVALSELDNFADGKIKSVNSIAYGPEHGLTSTVGTAGGNPAAFRAKDGKIWFANLSGANAIDPAKLSTNLLPPPVHIEQTLVNGVAFDPTMPADVAPGRGDLTFRYSGLSFVAPEKVRFKYQLVGYDLGWVDAGNRREAFYSNIPPGHYRFRVIAANSDEVWNNEGASFSFRLRPYFYQTGWFRALVIAGFVLAIVGGIRWRMLQLQHRAAELQRMNEELERRIAERTGELAKSYEALRASEYFYHSLVESLPQIIARKDAAGRYTYANRAFAELIKRPLAEVTGATDAQLYPSEEAERLAANDRRALATREVIEYESVVERPSGKRYLHAKIVPLFNAAQEPIGVLQLFWDMSLFRETEAELKQTRKELIEASRQAGMAEVATGVLHNIGNVLNSVNVSANMAGDSIRKQRIPGLAKVSALLLEQRDRLVEFFTSDPRGLQLPSYVAKLTEHLEAQREQALGELKSLQQHIDHIKEIVVTQQSYAGVSAVVEIVPVNELVESALQLCGIDLSKHGITVVRNFQLVPLLNVPRQRVLQILINLIRNATDAITEYARSTRTLTLAIRQLEDGQVELAVTDSGIGIAPENLTRIFAFGFTTKKNGHGFGLHGSALTAKEMGGSLRAESAGVGQGATFVLELPAAAVACESA